MHRNDVSDSHSVPSHPVCPIRPSAVNATKPRLDPCTVTDADPVLPMLARCITLRLRSSENASDMLRPSMSDVNVKRRVCWDPCPARHRTDVSDSHSVPSHPVCPIRPSAVNAILPGVIRTPMVSYIVDEYEERLASGLPLGRIGEPMDVASAALFLASDDSAWVSGLDLTIDGGQMASTPKL